MRRIYNNVEISIVFLVVFLRLFFAKRVYGARTPLYGAFSLRAGVSVVGLAALLRAVQVIVKAQFGK